MEEGGKLPPEEMFYVAPSGEMAETRNTQALGMTRVACAIGVPLPPTPCLGAKGVWLEDVEAPMLSAANEHHSSGAAAAQPTDRSQEQAPPRRTPGRTDSPRRPPLPAAAGKSKEPYPTPRGDAPPTPTTTPPECALSEPPAGKQCPSGCKSTTSLRFDAPSEPPAEEQRPSGKVPVHAPLEPPAEKQRPSGIVSNPSRLAAVTSQKSQLRTSSKRLVAEVSAMRMPLDSKD